MASEATLPAGTAEAALTTAVHDKLNKGPHKIGVLIFAVLLTIGFVYALWNLIADVSHIHHPSTFAFLLLGVALLVALGFEFVNGFHDTANAVATVIYTHVAIADLQDADP